jgi:hypothetical protein
MTRALVLAAALCPVALLPLSAHGQSLTLFGQEYTVQRFDYSQQVQWDSPAFPGELISIFESEGIYFHNGKLIMTADDIADVYIGNPDNFVVEVSLVLDGSGAVTGLEYSRTLVAIDAVNDGYDPNPGGVTVNPSPAGLAAGGDLVLAGNDGQLFGYSLQTGSLGQPLEFPTGSGCLSQAPGSCFMALGGNLNAEDAVFVPGFGNRPDAFFVINQDLGGLDQTGIEIWSTTGTFVSSFLVGADADSRLMGAVAKGITFLADAPSTPAAIRRPGGTVLVSFDRDFPALQAFAADGTFLATEFLTTNELPNGSPRLDMTGCNRRLHLESLTADSATGRLFLNNQGTLLTCNFLWILTPVSSVAPCVADYNRDAFINLDDLGDFITDFYTDPAIPGGTQPSAPTYPDLAVGFSGPCPAAADAPPPYAITAYRSDGYRVGFSPDGSNTCPFDPSQLFPNLDNLNDFITSYYSTFEGGGC